jgi:hypothetical protein
MRAFTLAFSVTQRDAAYRRSPIPAVGSRGILLAPVPGT